MKSKSYDLRVGTPFAYSDRKSNDVWGERMTITTKVLYTLYVAAVLLFAGTARANELTNLKIDEVVFHDESLVLDVKVSLPNPCHSLPQAELVQDSQSPNTLILRMTSQLPLGGFCISKVKPVTAVVSLPELVQSAQLDVEKDAAYLIKAEGSPFEMIVLGSFLL